MDHSGSSLLLSTYSRPFTPSHPSNTVDVCVFPVKSLYFMLQQMFPVALSEREEKKGVFWKKSNRWRGRGRVFSTDNHVDKQGRQLLHTAPLGLSTGQSYHELNQTPIML